VDSTEPLPITAWALTTGEAGMRSQARGLAAAVAAQVEERIVRLRSPWSSLPTGSRFLLTGMEGDPLTPPWPGLIVTCGRKAGAVAVSLRKRGCPALLAHIQDPLVSPDRFDLVFAMVHDRVSGPNVTKQLTALHEITPQRLNEAKTAWADRFGTLPKPVVTVLLGGATQRTPFGAREAKELDRQLQELRARIGKGSVLIVPSRRTASEVLAYFAGKAAADPSLWLWRGEGDNPYRGALAWADHLVVTGDSISMVSEALASHVPVDVFVPPLRGRHAHFLDNLEEAGAIHRLDDAAAATQPFSRVPDATAIAAAITRQLWDARRRG
jgi:hypothetical protein